VATITSAEARALELALADHALLQSESPRDIWKSLEHHNLVRPLQNAKRLSWMELTEAGCRALRAVGGPAFRTHDCFSCENTYAYPQSERWNLTECPVCGFLAGDE
jgi:hypothetical protein